MQTLARDLSWLRFNARVLQEAQTATVPLLERLKFLAIFSSNLDEFFKVRVATLRRLAGLKKKTRARLTEPPRRVLKAVLAEVQRQQADFGRTFRDELLPALRAEGIHLCPAEELTEKQRLWVADYCRTAVAPLLTPVALDAALPELFLKDQAVYLTLHLTQPLAPAAPPAQVLVLELPTKRHGGRFVTLPDAADGTRTVVFLDDVVRVGAAELFPAYQQVAVHSIKLSRDAELDIEEEVSGNVSGDVMEKIRRSVAKRATGYPARLLHDPAAPPAVLAAVLARTGIPPEALVEGSRYHNFRDFFGFPGFGEARLAYPKQRPVPHRTLPAKGSLLAAIATRDHLLHPPYHAFDPVPRLLREAAADPRVSAIRITLYRVAGKSAVVKALLKAARNGKQVTAVVELKARFDEESNLYWAEKLQRAGAHVVFTAPELKCHAKLLLISRREVHANDAYDDQTRHYAYLSTGNFNEATSEIYTDHGLFTADERLTAEVAQVFEFLAHPATFPAAPPPALRHLLVAPFGLKSGLEALIDFEIKEARKGRPSGIILKINALEHPHLMQRLAAAAHAGVPVELVVRGINCLVPTAGLTARGLVDRYLEHSRVYVFHHRGEARTYLSSADWMTRNLERRVEVAFPVLDDALRAEIHQLLDFQRRDTVKARDYDNAFIAPAPGQKPLRAQTETRRWLGRRK